MGSVQPSKCMRKKIQGEKTSLVKRNYTVANPTEKDVNS